MTELEGEAAGDDGGTELGVTAVCLSVLLSTVDAVIQLGVAGPIEAHELQDQMEFVLRVLYLHPRARELFAFLLHTSPRPVLDDLDGV